MLEKLKYINHVNEEIIIGNGGIFVNENDLHDFAWNATSKNDRISAFKKGIVKHTIPLMIVCDSEEEGIAIRNRIFEVMEKDVLAMQHGKFVIGEYYMKCFVTGSKKSDYLTNKGMMSVKLTVQTDFPSWVKETTTTFNYGSGHAGTNLDYNNDFPYDYTSNLLGKSLENTSFYESNFIINVYGACVNPKVTIGGHDYEVLVELEANEYLTINSIDKTVILTKEDGTKVNCFNLRNRDSYMFQKIPSGTNLVSENGNFKFDITLLEERGEPKWI